MTKRSHTRYPHMTVKQAAFVEHFLAGKSQAEAARLAGYQGSATNMDKIGSQVRNNEKVAAAIRLGQEELQKATRLDTERVLKEVGRIALFDARQLFNDDGTPKGIHQLDDDTAACISGIKIVTKGNADLGIGEITEYKINDKNSALEKLMKHLGLYEKDNKQKGMLAELPRELVQLIADKLRNAQ